MVANLARDLKRRFAPSGPAWDVVRRDHRHATGIDAEALLT